MTVAKTSVIKLWLWHWPPLKCFTVSGTFLVPPGLFTRCLYTVSLSLPSLAEPGQLCGRLGLISFGHCLSSCHSIQVVGTGRQQARATHRRNDVCKGKYLLLLLHSKAWLTYIHHTMRLCCTIRCTRQKKTTFPSSLMIWLKLSKTSQLKHTSSKQCFDMTTFTVYANYKPVEKKTRRGREIKILWNLFTVHSLILSFTLSNSSHWLAMAWALPSVLTRQQWVFIIGWMEVLLLHSKIYWEA